MEKKMKTDEPLTAAAKVLANCGRLETAEAGGALILRNDGQPSFLIERIAGIRFRISPLFERNINPSEWWTKADRKAIEIGELLSAALTKVS